MMRKKIILFFLFLLIFFCGIKGFSKYYTKKNYNIILITIDMLRADRVGVYGYKGNTTPNIDVFAKKNIIFMNAYSQGSWTPPSLASILSGVYPNEHGVGDWDNIANPKVKFLVDRLPKDLYTTAFFTNHPSLFLDNLGFTKGYSKKVILKNKRANELTKLAIDWLGKNISDKKSFALWIHYFDPHEPFTPSEPFLSNFIKKYKNIIDYKERPPVCEKENYYGLNCIPPYIIEKDINDLNYYSLLYDAEIAETDDAIGNLLKQIEKMKLMNNTIIIITSDHGEIIKRCGVLSKECVYLSHGTFLFKELIHVPFIMHIPSYNKYIKIIDNIATIDILPTLSFLIKDMSNQGYDGLSLLPLNNINKYRKIYSYEIRLNWIASIYKRWELIDYNDFKEMYRLDSIEDELIEFPNIYEPILTRIKNILDNSLKGRRSIKYVKEKPLNMQLIENLKSLGYCGNIENYFDKLK